MSTNLDCFKYTVGTSNTTCECYDTDKPSDYNVSDSGLFLTDLEGLNIKYPRSAAECGRGNLWELLDKAKNEGAMAWRTAVMNYIGQRTVRKRNYFSGVIGDDRTDNTKLALNKNFAGLSWKLPTVRGGKMRIKRIAAFFESATPIDVVLYGNEHNSPLYSWNITPVANRVEWYTLPTPVELDLVRDIPRARQFWLVYPTAGAPRPLKHKITCGCGELSKRNLWSSHPTFVNLSNPEARYNWLEWMVITGTTGDLITQREENWQHSNYGYGLMIDAEFVCNGNEVLCVGELDYLNDEVAMVQAYGLRYMQGEKLADLFLSTDKLNRYTMLEREAMYGKRNHYRKEADLRAQYVAQELTSADRINLINDCFSCKNKHGFILGSV